MAYDVPALPYDYDGLEPYIDETTMRLHRDKSHQGYVNKVNAALEGTEWADRPIDEVIANLHSIPEDIRGAVRNHGGGHCNHSLFWEWLSPDGGGEPDGDLGEDIASTFGSFAEFQAAFKNAGINQFGSGWVWLVHHSDGLAIASTPNQENPLTYGRTPLLGVDVWEHAYYLTYQNRRPDYLDAVWNVVNWATVAERYAAASDLAPAHR